MNRLLLLASCALLANCRGADPTADLARIYDRAAQAEDLARNPVVVIPGLLGSKLVDRGTGRVVWGAFGRGFADPETPEGARLVAVPMEPGKRLEDLRDEVHATGALEELEVNVLGLLIRLQAYRAILVVLGVGGYRDEALSLGRVVDYGDEHFTCFQFAYDWRRGVAENAAELARFLEEKAEYVQRERTRRFGAEAGARPVEFDVVAHSLGGLVVRWYLRFGGRIPGPDGDAPPLDWAGARRIERAILIGTPNLGSVEALSELVHGMDLGLFAAEYPAAVVGTMPVAYQLLPRARHGALADRTTPDDPVDDLFDPALWEARGWGLLDPDQTDVLAALLPDLSEPGERRRVARAHLELCLTRARAVTAGLDAPAAPPAGTELFLFCGDAIDTPSSAWYDARDGALWTRSTAPGDGTVLRSSALGDERSSSDSGWAPRLRSPIHWSGVYFLFRDHLELVKDSAFMDNVLYLLLEDPRGG